MIGRRLFTLGAAGLALGACEDRMPSAAVYALVDVSGSYFRELGTAVRTLRVMMAGLRAHDSFAVAEIGACSFSDDAVLLRFTAPDRPTERTRLIAANAQRLNDYANKARATNFTDIRGALTQAAQYLASREAEHRSIVVFSDFEEDLAPTCRRDTPLPRELRGMTVIATNVTRLPEDNRDPARYARRLESWRKLVDAAGASWRLMPDPADVVAALRAS
jgi:hypothetical protein